MIISALKVIAIGSLVMEQVQCALTVKRFKANNQTNQTLARSVVNDVPPYCFPAVGFKMPYATPTSLTNWWCNTDAEYAFVGFSYDISSCNFIRNQCFSMMLTAISFSGQSLTQLKTDFLNMRRTFNTRYVRLYEACDRKGF